MTKWISAALAAVAMLAASLGAAPAAAATAGTKTPVVFVHGYGACQDAAVTMEGPFAEQYYTGTPAADLHHIAFYGCDTDGESIAGAGPLNASSCDATAVTTTTAADGRTTTIATSPAAYYRCNPALRTPDGDRTGTSISRFAYELAWYLYGKFGSTKPVDLVGASMGGLIITYMLQRIAAHDPIFPSALKVPAVVTFSTPYGGAFLGSYADLELLQMLPTNAYSIIPAMLKTGAVQMNKGGYTIWAAIGSDGCDAVPSSSATGLPRTTFTMVYKTPCYTHSGYLWDAFANADAVGTENGKPFTGGLHALDFMHYVIDYQERYGS